MTDEQLKQVREVVAALEAHASAMAALEPGKPHWEQATNDFNVRMQHGRVTGVVFNAREALSALLAEREAMKAVVDAARKVAVWADPGDEVPSPYSDSMATDANALRAALRALEPKEARDES